MRKNIKIWILALLLLPSVGLLAASEEGGEYDPISEVMHHISDANQFHVWGDIYIPLLCIMYAPDEQKPLTYTWSSAFDHGHTAIDGYVLNHGRVNRIADPSFPKGEVHGIEILGAHGDEHGEEEHGEEHGNEHGEEVIPEVEGEIEEGEVVEYVLYEGKQYKLDQPSTLGGGLLSGAGITSFYDFSITKNVFSLFLVAILLCLVFFPVARGYKKNDGKAPSGIQSFMEPFFMFIREEVTRPMIGEKHYERFQPFIMTLFFFILFCNLLGLIPFFPGSANITGNIAVTLTLAVLTFIVTNINGNAHYWQHIFWMPGIPAWVKIILTPVEILGLIIKPFSLMIRLFANITAGHIIILSLIGLIFLFGNNGESVGGATAGALVGGLFTAFMNLIEIIVAFLQAFIFAILSASYIGAAVEDGHHDDHAAEAAH